jgi:hypothetical protein
MLEKLAVSPIRVEMSVIFYQTTWRNIPETDFFIPDAVRT